MLAESTAALSIWTEGDTNRRVSMRRPCPCGCDNRGRSTPLIGYMTGSNKDGTGFTLVVDTEDAYQALRSVVGGDT